MADGSKSFDQSEPIPVATLEVQRGVRFALFPEDTPLLYRDSPNGPVSEKPGSEIVAPNIHVQGIEGFFHPNFSGSLTLNDPEELAGYIDTDSRVVMVTKDGPVELVSGANVTNTGQAVTKGKYSELFSWILPESVEVSDGIVISIFMPRFNPIFTPASFDNDHGGPKYYHAAVDEDGSEIDSIIIPTDPKFLRKIEVEIS